MGTNDKPLPGTTNDDAYDQGVAAGRIAERDKIAAWLHAQSTIQGREAFLNGGANEVLVAKVVTLIADTIKRAAQAIQEGKHAMDPVSPKTDSTE